MRKAHPLLGELHPKRQNTVRTFPQSSNCLPHNRRARIGFTFTNTIRFPINAVGTRIVYRLLTTLSFSCHWGVLIWQYKDTTRIQLLSSEHSSVEKCRKTNRQAGLLLLRSTHPEPPYEVPEFFPVLTKPELPDDLNKRDIGFTKSDLTRWHFV